MTARELVLLLLRRWYLVAFGAAFTVGAMYVTAHQQGVYWTKLTLVLLAPAEQRFPNKMQDPHYSLAPLAGAVVAEWNQDHAPLLTASDNTTLFGEGKRDAEQVRMPNQGSQWKPLYLSPNIDIQVVGGDAERVGQRAIEISDELTDLLAELQEGIGVNPKLRVTSVRSPETPTIYYVAGSRPRALAAVGLLGALTTFVAVYWFERLLTRRRSSGPHNEAPAEHSAHAEAPSTISARGT